MRTAYLDDLRSKFLLENSVLKMEYAEVRVLHLAHKVWAAMLTSIGPYSRPHHTLALPFISGTFLVIFSLPRLNPISFLPAYSSSRPCFLSPSLAFLSPSFTS
jgi:hypothetical protein